MLKLLLGPREWKSFRPKLTVEVLTNTDGIKMRVGNREHDLEHFPEISNREKSRFFSYMWWMGWIRLVWRKNGVNLMNYTQK